MSSETKRESLNDFTTDMRQSLDLLGMCEDSPRPSAEMRVDSLDFSQETDWGALNFVDVEDPNDRGMKRRRSSHPQQRESDKVWNSIAEGDFQAVDTVPVVLGAPLVPVTQQQPGHLMQPTQQPLQLQSDPLDDTMQPGGHSMELTTDHEPEHRGTASKPTAKRAATTATVERTHAPPTCKCCGAIGFYTKSCGRKHKCLIKKCDGGVPQYLVEREREEEAAAAVQPAKATLYRVHCPNCEVEVRFEVSKGSQSLECWNCSLPMFLRVEGQ